MTYAKPFFDLQLDFAETVSRMAGIPLARAALDYTNLYIRFGLGRAFDPEHPRWQEYVTGLDQVPREWTYRFYTARRDGNAAPGIVATFGCFAYARSDDGRIRLHFENVEMHGRSPLADDRRDQRKIELASLFAHVKETVKEPVRVAGASWLYNLDVYRRLFPDSYLETAQVLRDRFRHMPLWGQFVNRRGDIREPVAAEFRDRLARQPSLERLHECFPLQVLAVEAPVN